MERRAWLLQWPDAALTHGRNQAPCRAPGLGVCLNATWYEALAYFFGGAFSILTAARIPRSAWPGIVQVRG
ncbi:hypothetical protein JCM30394_09220 [Deferrisoma palaeochoriense]